MGAADFYLSWGPGQNQDLLWCSVRADSIRLIIQANIWDSLSPHFTTSLVTFSPASVASQAGKIMNWLRDIAAILAKHNRGVVWTVPTGFVVIHEMLEPKKVRARV